MRGLSYKIVPIFAAAAALFGVVWGWVGINAAIHGGGPVAYLLILFGFGGIVLSMALWRTWKMVRARINEGR